MGDGDFSFLNDDPEALSSSYKVRRSGEDFWRTDASSVGPNDEMAPQDTTPSAEPGTFKASDSKADPIQAFQKKRAQAADFAKNETLKGLDRLQAAHSQAATMAGRFGGTAAVAPMDYEGAKQRILASAPENYASALEREANQHGLANDDVLRGSEEAVQNYKRLTLQQQPQQAQQIQQQLSTQDAPTLKAGIQRLGNEIEQAKQDMAVAATGRQRQQIKDKIDFYSSQQRQLQRQLPPEQETQADGQPLDKDVNIDAIATAAGVPRSEIITANAEMRRMVQAHGVALGAAVTPMTFPLVVTNLVSSMFNPQKAAQLLSEMLPEQKPQPQEQGRDESGQTAAPGQKPAGPSDQERQINTRMQALDAQVAQRENRRDKIWQELRNSRTFNNVGDVLGFIVCSVLIGAQNAAHIFTNMDKVGSLRWELDKLDHETSTLYHQQDSYLALAQHARQNAAQEQHFNASNAETERHHRAMEAYTNFKGIKGGGVLKPEDKEHYFAIEHGLRFAYGDVQQKEKDVIGQKRIVDSLRGASTPEGFKLAREQEAGALKSLAAKEAAAIKARDKHAQVQEFARKWALGKGYGDIFPTPPTPGTSFTMPKEEGE